MKDTNVPIPCSMYYQCMRIQRCYNDKTPRVIHEYLFHDEVHIVPQFKYSFKLVEIQLWKQTSLHIQSNDDDSVCVCVSRSEEIELNEAALSDFVI